MIVGMEFSFSLANLFILNVAERWQESSRQSFSLQEPKYTELHIDQAILLYSFFDLFSPFSLQRVIFGKLKQLDSIASPLRAAISYALLPIWLGYNTNCTRALVFR